MLTQTLAIFIDAYRQLNNRRLFWFTLALSTVLVLAFTLIGINERGVTVAGYVVLDVLTTAVVPADAFYKFVFVQIGVKFWLTWAAAILALISTAGIIPEFIAQSSIEITLAKPISRLRLFLTKYCAGMLFAALQVTLFSGASFLVIGLRGGSWEPRVFLAVPLVVLFFSYLYCFCALLGVLTRSTIASLLGTIIFWFVVFAGHATESAFLAAKVRAEQRIVAIDSAIAAAERAAAEQSAGDAEKPTTSEQGIVKALADSMRGKPSTERVERWRERRAVLASDLRTYALGHRISYAVKTVLPKTSETMDLLSRQMLSLSEIAAMTGGDRDRDRGPPPSPDDPSARVADRKAEKEIERILRERPVWWVIGTSLLFEALVLLIAARVFTRRDY